MKKLKGLLSIVLALVLALVIMIAVVPLGAFEFKAEASEDVCVKEENATAKVDYSNLTSNQYLAMLFTNNNYCGSLNDYGTKNDYPPYALLDDYLLNPEKTSRARSVYDTFSVAYDYKTTRDIYGLLKSQSSYANEQMKLEDYYTAMIFSVVTQQMNDNNFIDSLNCEANKTILSLSTKTAQFLENTSKYERIDTLKVTEIDSDDLEAIAQIWAFDEDCEELWNLVGKDVSVIKDIISAVDTINDAVINISNFAQLAYVNEFTKAILKEIYLNCPADNPELLSAARRAYDCANEKMSYEILTFYEAMDASFEYLLCEMIDIIWEETLKLFLGDLIVTSASIGAAIGSEISNFCFATDAVDEQMCVISALIDFENTMVDTVKSLRQKYIINGSEQSSENFIKSIYMLNATYELGCEYVEDWVDIVYTKGYINNIKYADSEELAEWKQLIAIQKVSNTKRKVFLLLQTYKEHFEIDAPLAYKKYFGEGSGFVDITQIRVIQQKQLFVGDEGFSTNLFDVSYLPVDYTYLPIGLEVSSSDESIIAVERSGEFIGGYIKIVGEGTCTLTFTTYNLDCSTSIDITINEGLEEDYIKNFKYSENSDGKTATITGYTGTKPDIIIPNKIGDYTITTIGEYAFQKSTVITDVIIPEGIKTISTLAFSNCYYLKSVVIPSTVTYIGTYAFQYCDSLTQVTMFNGVKTVDSGAFRDSDNLTSFIFPDSVTALGEKIFLDCDRLQTVVLPKNIKSIPIKFFRDCDSLANVNIPDGVTNIGYDAFRYCNLKSVVIPDSVTSIGDCAFNECENLQSVILSKNLSSVPYQAFYDCTNLTSVIIPEGIKSIGNQAFRNTALRNVVIPSTVSSIGVRAFENCNSLSKVEILDGVKTICSNAFLSCDILTNVIIPNSVTTIDASAFSNCICLRNITIPESVTKISDKTFYNGERLNTIIIPRTVTSIGNSAFYNCSQLKTVYYDGTSSEWSTITIGTNNSHLLNANIICLGDLSFSGATLTINDNLAVDYKVKIENVADYSNLYVKFVFKDKEYIVKKYTTNDTNYTFKFDDIAPNLMTETIYATLYGTKDGVEYASAQTEYSVAQYCYNMLDKCSDDKYAEFRTLLVDLLNYGTQSQTYSNVNTNNLANASLTDTQKAWGTQTDPELETVQNLSYETIENPTVAWKGGTLMLNDSISMRFTIETADIENLSVKISALGNTYTVNKFESIGNNRYYVYFNVLNASQMSEEVYLTVYGGDTAVSNTLRYSIESYAYAKAGGTDTKLSDLVIAMMKYGNAAYEYMN